MPKKTVTQKSQISKWYAKRIKDFTNLTENEALFEYEALKLRERQRKFAKKAGISRYKAPAIPRPSVTTSRDVEYLKEFTTSEVKASATTGFDQLVSPSARIYNYELESWKEEKFPGYEARYDYEWHNDYDWVRDYDYEEPEDSADNYWIDPETGEAVSKDDISSLLERGREFIDRLIDYTNNEAASAMQSQSSYRSGRTKSPKSRAWLDNNIMQEQEQIINQLTSIRDSEDKLKDFVIVASKGDYLQEVQDAIGERIHQAYKTAGKNSFNNSELYSLLNQTPLTLEEALSFGDMLNEDGEEYM